MQRTINMNAVSHIQSAEAWPNNVLTLQRTCLRDVKLLLQICQVSQRGQEIGAIRCPIEQFLPETVDLVVQICNEVKRIVTAGRHCRSGWQDPSNFRRGCLPGWYLSRRTHPAEHVRRLHKQLKPITQSTPPSSSCNHERIDAELR